MATARQVRENRKQLERDMAAALKAKDRARLRDLRRRVAEARRGKRTKLREVKQLCRQQRRDLRVQGRDQRDRARAEIAAHRARIVELRAQLRALPKAIRSARKAQASSCSTGQDDTRQALERELAQALGALAAERDDQRLQRLYKGRATLRTAPRSSRAERASESDDEVRNNLPHELVPVFDALRSKIRGNSRRSRTEAFLEYVHDHPGMVLEIGEQTLQRDLERLEQEERRFAREIRSGRRYRGPGVAAALEEAVPF